MENESISDLIAVLKEANQQRNAVGEEETVTKDIIKKPAMALTLSHAPGRLPPVHPHGFTTKAAGTRPAPVSHKGIKTMPPLNESMGVGVRRNSRSNPRQQKQVDLKEIEELARKLNGEPRTKLPVSRAVMFGRYYYDKGGNGNPRSVTGTMTPEESKGVLARPMTDPPVGSGGGTVIRYMRFRPYTKDLSEGRPPQPADLGYYYKFLNGEVTIIGYLLEDNGFRETPYENWTLLWNVGPIRSDIYAGLLSFQKVNHFPRSHEITRKDLMNKNISQMQLKHGLSNYNFIPKTFILPAEASLLKDDANRNKGRWYIAKPAASSQGKGIFVTDDPDLVIKLCHALVNDAFV
jgi:hypothetical protein